MKEFIVSTVKLAEFMPILFDVYFEDMDVEGWPAGVGEDLDNWEEEDIAKINEALDAGAIRMKPNKEIQDEIDLEITKLQKNSSPTSQSQVRDNWIHW